MDSQLFYKWQLRLFYMEAAIHSRKSDGIVAILAQTNSLRHEISDFF